MKTAPKKNNNMNKKKSILAVVLLSVLVLTSCSHKPTKDEWISKVPNAEMAKMARQLACSKKALFKAVGSPSKTQTIGDDLYLYWSCSDGQIQVKCNAPIYNAGDQVVGNINDY